MKPTKKALELACAMLPNCPLGTQDIFPNQYVDPVDWDCFNKCGKKGYTPTDCWKRYFIKKAKEK